jgi:adenine-specific DNA-methyltransferase
VEGPQERYQINWPGKREALLTANAPIAKTLRPCREESVDFDTTQNLFIEGDNLDALKLLQETYLNKVKLIYIDPPYNTGNDFIYEDDFSQDAQEFFKRSNQTDEFGGRLVANAESNGRFHSDWLSMMYARLRLARNMLREDGVILVSIDDVEFPNLRRILDEIFGEQNFLAALVWDRNRKNDAKYFSVGHEYMVVYAKNESLLSANSIVFRGEKDGVEDVKKAFNELVATNGSDWTAKHVYFVAETKGSMSSMDLRKIEESKIECARKFFAKITSDQVKYDVVVGYGKLMELVS